MSEFHVGSILRAVGVFTCVFMMMALVYSLDIWSFPCPISFEPAWDLTFEESMKLATIVAWGAGPKTALLALLQSLIITVFVMNRIHTLPLILVCAFLILLFVAWAPMCGMFQLSASSGFWSFGRLLEELVSEKFAMILQILMLLSFALCGAFFIIKMVAAAEKGLATRAAGNDSIAVD